jgi:hypothetical protein
MVKKFLKFSPIFLLLVVIPSCSIGSRRPVLNLKNEPLPTLADGSTYTKEQVQKAIFEGCKRRGWIAQLKEDGIIEASIIVRENRAKVEIRYDETKISILYKDSYNLHYSNGTINRRYNLWIEYLYSSIIRELDYKI